MNITKEIKEQKHQQLIEQERLLSIEVDKYNLNVAELTSNYNIYRSYAIATLKAMITLNMVMKANQEDKSLEHNLLTIKNDQFRIDLTNFVKNIENQLNEAKLKLKTFRSRLRQIRKELAPRKPKKQQIEVSNDKYRA